MPRSEPEPSPPLHPIQEGGGFLYAIMTAVRHMFWPSRHRQRPGGPLIADEDVAPVNLDIAEKISTIAPYPVDD